MLYQLNRPVRSKVCKWLNRSSVDGSELWSRNPEWSPTSRAGIEAKTSRILTNKLHFSIKRCLVTWNTLQSVSNPATFVSRGNLNRTLYRCALSLVAGTFLVPILQADILYLNIFTSSPHDGVILLTVYVACTLGLLFQGQSSKVYTKVIVWNGFCKVMGLYVIMTWGLQYSGVWRRLEW